MTMLKAAWGLMIRAKPRTPEAIMAKATGILVNRSTKRMTHPIIPISTGLMV